jgi:hypothetical protein
MSFLQGIFRFWIFMEFFDHFLQNFSGFSIKFSPRILLFKHPINFKNLFYQKATNFPSIFLETFSGIKNLKLSKV